MDRVLLIRLGALGDVVHAIPVAAALRHAFPAARIDWLVSAKHRELLDLVPVINRRLVIDDSSIFSAIRELRRGRYDVVLDLQGLVKSAALARSSGAPRIIGFASAYLRERFARPFYTEAYDPGGGGTFDPREGRHIVEINLELLKPLGLSVHAVEFPIDQVDRPAVREAIAGVGGQFALLNPGAAWPNKRWPPDRFGALARAVLERHRLPSLVVWGPGEEALAGEVSAASAGAARIAPPTSIADLVALARAAAVMVAGDTGPAHVAGAVGTPLVMIHGPTRPSRNGPWRTADVAVSRDAICRCHHLRHCRIDRMCLLDIGVDEVSAAVDRRLALEPTHV